MPSVSAKQARTMAAAAHDPKFAKKMGIPMDVAKDFNAADTMSPEHEGHRQALEGLKDLGRQARLARMLGALKRPEAAAKPAEAPAEAGPSLLDRLKALRGG